MIWNTISLNSKNLLYAKIRITTNLNQEYIGTCFANNETHLAITISGDTSGKWKSFRKSSILKVEILEPDLSTDKTNK